MEKIFNISNLWNSNNQHNSLGNEEILKIGSTINGIFNDIPNKQTKIKTPSIVVVGTQSSGKSSVLNGLLSMDILPTGKNMVTRTPLNIDLIQTNKDMWCEFGNYQNSSWEISKKIRLTHPLPSDIELDSITKQIKIETDLKAGKDMGISNNPINIKIYSPLVPNLNLVDLPGLTMVACTDKGQPKDIKDQIRNMVKNYILSERTIILAILPAREDLEADFALDLVKEVDPNFDRTVGVLTKIDLMNKDTDISKYLDNNVSKDLILNYGYFAVKNRSNSEMNNLNIFEGFEKEKEYFKLHPVYKNINNQNRLGIHNLGNSLSNILVENLRKYLPNILNEINIQLRETKKQLAELGNPVPTETEGKIALLNSIINNICSEFYDSLEKKGTEINAGRKVKDIFVKYRNNLDNINPFDEEHFQKKYILDIINNCEGNHMSFPLPPIEVLECCILDSKNAPFNSLIPLSIECVKDISLQLIQLSSSLLEKEEIKRFNKLFISLKELMINTINQNQEITINKINEIIEMEKNYIWTDDPKFLDNLSKMFSKFQYPLDPELMRQILIEYFSSIKEIIKHLVPKCVMLFLVRKLEKSLQSILFEKIQKKEFITLLSEDSKQHEKRINLQKYIEKLLSAKYIIEKL